MTRFLRSFALGLLVGGLAGLGAGMNIAKGQALLSNPFAEVSITERAERTARDAADQTAEGVEAAGKAAKEKLQ